MATWDSTYLLGYFNRLIGRKSTSDAITDATKYQMLSEAQNELIADIASAVPHVVAPTAATASLTQLTVSAAGDIATFGTDSNGYAVFPMGKGGVYGSLNDIPTNPLVPGVDYMNEGTQIRALNNTSLPSTLYWYGTSQPADIDATHQPSINPESARELIGIRAAYNFGTEGNRNPALAAVMAQRYGFPLVPAPGRFAGWCLTWRTQFRQPSPGTSFTGMQLAIMGQPMPWAT